MASPSAWNSACRPKSRTFKRPTGGVHICADTDLKRHNLNDVQYDYFDNEQISQGSLVGFADPNSFTLPPEPRPTGAFLTRKPWDVGNSAPYGHRGDLTTMTEAIHFHGGAARVQRDAFFALSSRDRNDIVEFLKSLQAQRLSEAVSTASLLPRAIKSSRIR